jgi:hypothetical protein
MIRHPHDGGGFRILQVGNRAAVAQSGFRGSPQSEEVGSSTNNRTLEKGPPPSLSRYGGRHIVQSPMGMGAVRARARVHW